MTEQVSTYDVLLSLGFKPDPRVFSDEPGGLTIDFGNAHLTASYAINLSGQPVVVFAGVLKSPSALCQVNFEMPRQLESFEQGTAWVGWFLDHHSHRNTFEPVVPVPWLSIGRENKNLLPWVKRGAAYDARPLCTIRRDYARVGLRRLRVLQAEASGDESVSFAFDGEIFSIRIGGEIIAMAGDGNPWPETFTVSAGDLQYLPQRLMRDPVCFELWWGGLIIDGRGYHVNPEEIY